MSLSWSCRNVISLKPDWLSNVCCPHWPDPATIWIQLHNFGSIHAFSLALALSGICGGLDKVTLANCQQNPRVRYRTERTRAFHALAYSFSRPFPQSFEAATCLSGRLSSISNRCLLRINLPGRPRSVRRDQDHLTLQLRRPRQSLETKIRTRLWLMAPVIGISCLRLMRVRWMFPPNLVTIFA